MTSSKLSSEEMKRALDRCYRIISIPEFNPFQVARLEAFYELMHGSSEGEEFDLLIEVLRHPLYEPTDDFYKNFTALLNNPNNAKMKVYRDLSLLHDIMWQKFKSITKHHVIFDSYNVTVSSADEPKRCASELFSIKECKAIEREALMGKAEAMIKFSAYSVDSVNPCYVEGEPTSLIMHRKPRYLPDFMEAYLRECREKERGPLKIMKTWGMKDLDAMSVNEKTETLKDIFDEALKHAKTLKGEGTGDG